MKVEHLDSSTIRWMLLDAMKRGCTELPDVVLRWLKVFTLVSYNKTVRKLIRRVEQYGFPYLVVDKTQCPMCAGTGKVQSGRNCFVCQGHADRLVLRCTKAFNEEEQ